MSPAAGGAAPAPAQSAAAAAAAAAVVAPAIAGQEPDRAPTRRDPQGPAEGADPANAAARKTAWGVLAPSPAAAAAAAANPAGGIIGGDASWPALAESKRGWPTSASSDSLKSLSDGSGPSAQEDSIAASMPPHPVVEVKPISTGSNPTSTLPQNAAATASSQQNGATTQPNQVRRSGSNGGNNGGGSRGNGGSGSRRAANNNGGGGSSGSGGDDHRNGGSLGSGSGCNSSNGDSGSSLNDNAPGSGTSANGNDSLGNNNGNNNMRGVSGRGNNNNGDGGSRSSGGGFNHWNNNSRNSNGASNGGGGRGGYRGRRDHERGGNFSPRNYPRVLPYHQQQQQPGFYQSGPFPRPPPPPATHFIVPQHFVPYAPPFPYHGDVQSYPLYLPPVEQFQNMHLVRPPMQPSWVPQDQPTLHEDIRTQIEFYFSTNNLCHDTFLRRHMNDQGWVPIDFILSFNRMRAFTGLVDTNYILDAIRGSEILEVQGNNVRRRNDWADWLLR